MRRLNNMHNNPSKWYSFNNHKELKRLRKDINETLTLKIELATSITLAIISFFLSDLLKHESNCLKITICIIMCFLVFLILFLLPYLRKKIAIWKSGSILHNGKIATNIFDDEIVYDVLVASEYSNSISQIDEKNKLRNELIEFYNIEIKYYISKSISALFEFNSNIPNIYGNKDNQIRIERVNNIVNLMTKILKNNTITLDDDVQEQYESLLDIIENRL